MDMAKEKLLSFASYEVGTLYDKLSCPKIIKSMPPS